MSSTEPSSLNREELFVLKRLVWNGILRRKEIESILSISSDYASRITSKIRSLVDTERQGKAYVFTDKTIPEQVGAQIFLEDLRRSVVENLPMLATAGVDIPVFVTASPDQHVDSNVLHDVVQAIRMQKGVGIAYTSMKAGDIARNRTIDPVALVLVNERWHVHAYARPVLAEDGETIQSPGGWRDFVLSRISRSYGLMEPSEVGLNDSDQTRLETHRLAPHPMLSSDQKLTVASAWNMKHGELAITMPATQWFYFKDRYVATQEKGPPERLLVEVVTAR